MGHAGGPSCPPTQKHMSLGQAKAPPDTESGRHAPHGTALAFLGNSQYVSPFLSPLDSHAGQNQGRCPSPRQ